MPSYNFEIEKREIYRFDIEAKDKDQAIRMFIQNSDYYIDDRNLDDVITNYEVTDR